MSYRGRLGRTSGAAERSRSCSESRSRSRAIRASVSEKSVPLIVEILLAQRALRQLGADLLAELLAHAVEVVLDLVLGDAEPFREGLVRRPLGVRNEIVRLEDLERDLASPRLAPGAEGLQRPGHELRPPHPLED